MKQLSITFLLSLCSAWIAAQKTVVPDADLTVIENNGTYAIQQISTGKIWCEPKGVRLFNEVLYGNVVFEQNGLLGLLHYDGKIRVKPMYTPTEYGEGMAYYEVDYAGKNIQFFKDGKHTLIDSNGKTVVPLMDCDGIYTRADGLYAMVKGDNIGFVKNKKVCIPLEYQAVPYYAEFSFDVYDGSSIAPLQKDYKIGFLHKNGSLVIQPQFDDVTYRNDRFWVGYLEKSNTESVQSGKKSTKAKHAEPTSLDILQDEQGNGLQEKGSVMVLSPEGKLLFSGNYADVYDVTDEFVLVDEEPGSYQQIGVVTYDQKMVLPFSITDLVKLQELHHYFVQSNAGKWGFFDLQHPTSLQWEYDADFKPFQLENGTLVVKKNGKMGILNPDGTLLQPFEYEVEQNVYGAADFPIVVKKNQQYGLIASDGTVIVSCQFDNMLTDYNYHYRVVKNGKMGLINQRNELLIPMDYDSIAAYQYAKELLVFQHKKIGLYRIHDGQVVDPIYDTLMNYGNIYLVKNNGLSGLVSEKGRVLLSPSFHVLIAAREMNAVALTNGVLTQYSYLTEKPEPVKADSAVVFPSTALYRFNDVWMMVDKKSQRQIGPYYSSVSPPNDKGWLAALPLSKDEYVVINSNGQEVKPNFHLTNSVLFTTLMESNTEDSLRYYTELWAAANSKDLQTLHTTVEEEYLFNEYGEELLRYRLNLYDKKSYFDPAQPLPANPTFQFNFYDFYSKLGPANDKGWRWAIPKIDPDAVSYEFGDQEALSEAVLVNETGEAVKTPNYIPVESEPFFTGYLDHMFDPQNNEDWKLFMDTLRPCFPERKKLSDEAMMQVFRNELLDFSFEELIYDEYGSEAVQYRLFLFMKHNVQLFHSPPPEKVRYQFYPSDFKAIRGAAQLPVPTYWEQFDDLLTRCYAFGNTHVFLYPRILYGKNKKEQAQLLQLLVNGSKGKLPQQWINEMAQFERNQRWVDLGVAHQTYVSEDQMSMPHDEQWLEQFDFLEAVDEVGLAMDNEIVVQPRFLAVGEERDYRGMLKQLVLTDGKERYFFDPVSKQLTKSEPQRLLSIQKGLVFYDEKTEWMQFYPHGRSLDKRSYVPSEWDYKAIQGVRAFWSLGPQSDIPFANIFGEDSTLSFPDGTLQYVYPPQDTLVYSPYHDWKLIENIAGYESSSGKLYWMLGNEARNSGFSAEALYANIQLNDSWPRNYAIAKQPTGFELSLGKQRLLLPWSTYNELIKQTPGTNGYGGVRLNGNYYSYQTLQAFPEQHDIIVRTGPSTYTVGNSKQLETVELSDENVIVRRMKIE